MTDGSGSLSRRGVLGASLGGVVAAALPGVLPAGEAAAAVPRRGAASTGLSVSGWQLRWSPSARTDGLGAFETVEDDRADSHPAGQPHIYPDGDDYRWNMHMVDRDTSTDRQRQEVTGMRSPAGGDYLQWLPGQTWRVTYWVYIPSSLKATTTFTHIMQMKEPGSGTSPIVVQSLRRVNGAPTIELQLPIAGQLVGRTGLDPLHDAWTKVDFRIRVGDGSSGFLRWILRTAAGRTLIDVSKSGIDTFIADRVRPKYGIYRSLGDTSGSLEDCYLLTTGMRGYQQVFASSAEHQAEDARISQGAVNSDHAGYTGDGFVNYDNVTGSYVEWSVDAAAAATAALTLRYANGTTANRPMTISVNGVDIATGVPFAPTGSWDTWSTTTVSVPLTAGPNAVRATATTAAGGPNVDKITLS